MDIGSVSNLASNLQSTNSATLQSAASAQRVSLPASADAAPVQTTTAVQQAAMTPSTDQLKQAVQEINTAMRDNARGLEFSVDDESERTIVKVIDKETQKVIRQIPTEETLAIAKSLDEAIGKLLKDKA